MRKVQLKNRKSFSDKNSDISESKVSRVRSSPKKSKIATDKISCEKSTLTLENLLEMVFQDLNRPLHGDLFNGVCIYFL